MMVVTVQVCSFCWWQAHPGKTPHRVLNVDPEPCADCGGMTRGGIFERREAPTQPEHE